MRKAYDAWAVCSPTAWGPAPETGHTCTSSAEAARLGITFPYDFGFIPATRAADGDPLDVLVLGEEPLFPGCLVTVLLVGVIQAQQTEHETFRNDRLLGASRPVNRPAIQTFTDLRTEHLERSKPFS